MVKKSEPIWVEDSCWQLCDLCMKNISCKAGDCQSKQATYLFVGTYTGGTPDKGIYVYRFNTKTGRLHPVSTTQDITNPSYLTLAPDGLHLYACTDTKMPNAGSVTAFAFDPHRGTLTLLNKQPSGGENPVYLAVDKTGKFVVNGNYTEGTLSVFPIQGDGSVGAYVQRFAFQDSSIIQSRQEKAHIHSTVFSPGNDYVFAPDLGSDKIRVFHFDGGNSKPLTLKEGLTVKTVLGSGPRHFAFHPNEQFAYCMEELSGMVSAYTYHNGKLDPIQRIFSYSKIREEYNSADIHISPDGLFLYTSNRLDGENTISIFSIDAKTGMLTLIGHQSTLGDHPRNFTLDPTGKFLLVANQVTGNIVVFKRNPKTGLLKKKRREVQVFQPSCLQMKVY